MQKSELEISDLSVPKPQWRFVPAFISQVGEGDLELKQLV